MFYGTFSRTDIAFDVYLFLSLKAQTRTKRGQGGRKRVICRLIAEYESLTYAKYTNERARHHEQAEDLKMISLERYSSYTLI